MVQHDVGRQAIFVAVNPSHTSTQVMWPDLTLARTGTVNRLGALVHHQPPVPDNCKSTSHTPAPSTQIQYTMISEAKWIYLNYVWVIVICINFCLLSRCIFLHLFCLLISGSAFCETTIDFFMHVWIGHWQKKVILVDCKKK